MYKTEMYYGADNQPNTHGASVHFCCP